MRLFAQDEQFDLALAPQCQIEGEPSVVGILATGMTLVIGAGMFAPTIASVVVAKLVDRTSWRDAVGLRFRGKWKRILLWAPLAALIMFAINLATAPQSLSPELAMGREPASGRRGWIKYGAMAACLVAAVGYRNPNLLADMSAQPTTLQSGLVSATKSTDTTGPTVTVNAPAANVSAVPPKAETK